MSQEGASNEIGEPKRFSDSRLGRIATLDDIFNLIFHGEPPLSPKGLALSAEGLAGLGGLDASGFCDGESHTPMTMAAAHGSIRWIEALRAAGASLEVPNEEGLAPLRMAIIHMAPRAAEKLLELGAPVGEPVAPDKLARLRLGALAHASAMGFSLVVEGLLARGADPCEPGPGGGREETPLMAACFAINSGSGVGGFSDYPAVARALLGAGARLSLPSGSSELERCCASLGDEDEVMEVASILVEAGADPLGACEDGMSFEGKARSGGRLALADLMAALAARAEARLISGSAGEPKSLGRPSAGRM